MTRPLIITRSDDLAEELLRLAAAAGVSPELVADPVAALPSWSAAPLVLVGEDVLAGLVALEPRRRDGVQVVVLRTAATEVFQWALALGAENVAQLPRSEGWVVERFADADEDRRGSSGRSIAVIGGSGGAGATTFACALAQVAARRGPTALIDADPFGPGLDRILGLERTEGVRWDALQNTTGRLSSRALRESLPRRGELGVLSWYDGATGTLQAFAAREAIAAAERGHDLVVVDLPRGRDPLVLELAGRCTRLVVVTGCSPLALAQTRRLGAAFAGLSVQLVVRGLGRSDTELRRATGIDRILVMPDHRAVGEAMELGAGPVRSRRGPLYRAATALLGELGALSAAA